MPSLYPLIKDTYSLNFVQIDDHHAATMQVTSSMMQPLVGLAADYWPQPYSLAVGMCVDARPGCCCWPARRYIT